GGAVAGVEMDQHAGPVGFRLAFGTAAGEKAATFFIDDVRLARSAEAEGVAGAAFPIFPRRQPNAHHNARLPRGWNRAPQPAIDDGDQIVLARFAAEPGRM